MELKKVTCPNCGSSEITKINGEQYKCNYCNTTFLIDYDQEDAQIISKKTDLKIHRSRMIFVAVGLILALLLFGGLYLSNLDYTESEAVQESSAKPELRLLDTSDIEAGIDLSEFTKAADTYAQDGVKEGYTGSWKRTDKPRLVGEYLLNSQNDNRLIFFYEYSWVKDDGESDKRYVPISFDDIFMTEDGRIKSDYKPSVDMHLEFLGNYFVNGYFDLSSAYRENITAHPEYTVTEIGIRNNGDGEEMTEAEVIALLKERGFTDNPITTEYTADGEMIDKKEVGESDETHPYYQTIFLSETGEYWTIIVMKGSVIANPVGYNMESNAHGAQLILSESEVITSYDSVTNSFYESIPNESELIVKTVDHIDAETLNSLTVEDIEAL